MSYILYFLSQNSCQKLAALRARKKTQTNMKVMDTVADAAFT